MDFPQLIGPSYTSFSTDADTERTVNLYLERVEATRAWAMYKAPGLSQFIRPSGGNGRVRGMFEGNGYLFAVIDATIYFIDSTGATISTFGPILDDGLPVVMCGSPTTLAVISAKTLYTVHSAALHTPAAPCTPISVAFLSGYFILLSDSNNQFFFTLDTLADTWDAGDVQTAEASFNTLIGMIVDHQELWMFGNRITQIFYVGPDADAPFVARQDAVIAMGLGASYAVQSLDNSLYWLGRNRDGEAIVYRANGYSPQRVSNHAIENALRQYGNLEDAIMWTHQTNGHNCFRLTFPEANHTWEYDVSVGNWTEPLYWNGVAYERHRGNCAVSAFGKTLVGDHTNGRIYQMSPSFYDDDGDTMRWLRRTPHTRKENKYILYKRLELEGETGVGLNVPSTVAGWDPQVMMRYSNDGGSTWSVERQTSMGKLGEYSTRMFFRNLGRGRNRIYEISGSDPVKVAFTGANFDADVGLS